ncbi:PREDICTED: NAD-dependent protein deacetylase sirtuin-7-like [Priapulus caudatus]|uniref:NAD-dependent protein deacetylase sirtuin-7-like n=1 Tax=Priapulus caudatus TaxID=37621 RepID=A0ABM1F5Y7_PRICU|nr:PREDICTED: NAD-dependent protein deacetylase sirtuin-7-like [Priapulus caudatus]
MSRVMRSLGLTVPRYDRNTDPIVHLAVPLRAHELTTTTRKLLLPSSSSSSSASVLPSNATANRPPVARGFIDDAVRATVDALLDAVCGAEEAVMAGAGAGGVVPGWFGKGCARRKPKRLKLSS